MAINIKNVKKKKNKRSKSAGARASEAPSVRASASDERSEEKKKRATAINYDEFVRVWSNAKSVTEVSEVMGVKRNSASAIAARLRKAGVVSLRNFPRKSPQPIDVKKLNKIASGKAD